MSSRVTSIPPTPLDIARRYSPPATCWAFPTRHVSRISNVNGYIFLKPSKGRLFHLAHQTHGLLRYRSRLAVLGPHFTLHRHDQTQGDDSLRSLSAAQLLLETARALSSSQSLRTNTQESFHSARDRRTGAAYGHRKGAQWNRTCAPLHP